MMDHGVPSERGVGWAVAAGLLLAFIGAFGARAASAQVIENPAKPVAEDAGRVVTPQQVLTITDEGTSDFYFSIPGMLRIAPDGSLVVRDENQVLLFDPAGRFRHNFFKKGQGPGEVSYVSDCLPTGKNLIVHSAYPDKLIFFDYSGRAEREIKVGPLPGAKRSQARIVMALAGGYLLQSREFPEFKGTDPYFDEGRETMLAMDGATGEVRPLQSFSTKVYAMAAPGGGGAYYDVASLIAVPFKGDLLAVSHTEDYHLGIFDPAANKIVREFRRPYDRVKTEPLTDEEKAGGAIIGNKRFGRPDLRFQNDILNVLTRSDEVWAVTSTRDKAKGVLIDVFDGQGVYRDAFYLQLPETVLRSVRSPNKCALDGEFLWVVEKAADDTSSIKKYRVAR